MGVYCSKRVTQILQGDSTGSVLEADGRDIRLALERNIDNFLATAEEEEEEEEEAKKKKKKRRRGGGGRRGRIRRRRR